METVEQESEHPEHLASYHRCCERIQANWVAFLNKREQRLEQQRRNGEASEKVAENILEDLFTLVLDWPLSNFNNQVEHADIVLTDLGIRYLIIEVKRPGSLAWNRRAIEGALAQALRYADEQQVNVIAISDGVMLYAANISNGGLRDRVFVSLSKNVPQRDLWWLSVHGIWRERQCIDGARIRLLPEEPVEQQPVTSPPPKSEALLHQKHKLPARCFAYVGDYSKPKSWKLPYLLADGTVDPIRLPKAAQTIVTNFRGKKVRGIPEEAIGAVLTRLGKAALQTGRLPPVARNPAEVYLKLAEVLKQFGITVEALCGHMPK